MANVLETIFSTEVLAIAIPAMIFAITIILVVKRLVGFVLTLLLLSFSIASGLAIINHDVIRDYVRGEYTDQEVQTWKDEVSNDLQQVWEALKGLTDQLIRQTEEEGPSSKILFGRIEQRLEQMETALKSAQAQLAQLPPATQPEAAPETLTAEPETLPAGSESLR